MNRSWIEDAITFVFVAICIFGVGWFVVSFISMDFGTPLQSPGSRFWAVLSVLAAIGLFAQNDGESE